MTSAVSCFLLVVVGCGAVMAGCPPTTVVSSLDLNKLMGKWYEHASMGTLFLSGLDKCKETNFSLDSDNYTIIMNHTRIPYMKSKQVSITWTATAKSSDPDGHLSLNLKLPVIGTVQIPLMVIDTDYDSYLILYLCRSFGFYNFNAGYIFTRKRSYSTAKLNKIYAAVDAALEKNRLQRRQFVLSNIKNCPADSDDDLSDTITASASSAVDISSTIMEGTEESNVADASAVVDLTDTVPSTIIEQTKVSGEEETKVESLSSNTALTNADVTNTEEESGVEAHAKVTTSAS